MVFEGIVTSGVGRISKGGGVTGLGWAGDDYDREPRAKRMMIQGRRMIDDDEGCQDRHAGSDAGAAGIV